MFNGPITILIADDDPDDRLMIKEALQEIGLKNPLDFVEDGEELMDYLKRLNKYTIKKNFPLPGLILLDLNMPRKDGREALKEIKSNSELRRIPVVALTTSKAEADIHKIYDMGGNSYIVKPTNYKELVNVMRTVATYWLEIVELPQ